MHIFRQAPVFNLMKSSSALRAISAFTLALLLFSPAPVFAASSDDPAAEIDRQRIFVDQTLLNVERQRSAQEAEEKAEIAARLQTQRKQEELRLAEQLKGLSGTLSGLPELPNFNGKFETQTEDQKTD